MALYGAGQEPQLKWVAFITILMFALAAFFAVFLGSTEAPLEFTVGMAGIFVVAGLICLAYTLRVYRSTSGAKRLLADGVAGTARITGLEQTGRYMNEQPHVRMELAVETKEHGSYTTSHAEYVPMVMLGTLTNGSPIAVRVDRNDRSKLVIDWDGSAGAGSAGAGLGGAAPVSTREVDPATLHGILSSAGMSESDIAATMSQVAGAPPPADVPAPWTTPVGRDAIKARVLATGTPAPATILASRPVGETDAEGLPVYEITLFVQVPGGQPIQGTSRVGVPLERVARIVQGATLPMKVDPGNPAVMAVDWNNA